MCCTCWSQKKDRPDWDKGGSGVKDWLDKVRELCYKGCRILGEIHMRK